MSQEAKLLHVASDWRRCYAPALERLGGDEPLFLELAEIFLVDSQALSLTLQQAIADRDAVLAARLLHTLAGLSANFDHLALVVAFQRAEQAAEREDLRSVRKELQLAQAPLAELTAHLQHVLEEERAA